MDYSVENFGVVVFGEYNREKFIYECIGRYSFVN